MRTAPVRQISTLARGCGFVAVTVGLLLSAGAERADALDPAGDTEPIELPLETLVSSAGPQGPSSHTGPRTELVPKQEGLAARLVAVPEQFVEQVLDTVNREHTARRLAIRDLATKHERVAQRRTDQRNAAQQVRKLGERATRRLAEREAQEREARERETAERAAREREAAEREAQERETAEREARERETAEREAQERETAEREAQEPESPQRAETRVAARSHWDRLADCESGNWIDGGQSFEQGSARWDWAKNGVVPPWGTTIHHGGLQFHPGTWEAFKPAGFPARAYDATRSQQIEVGERVLAAQGWGAWPVCSRKVGLR